MEENEQIKEKKTINKYKISTIILAIWVGILMISSIGLLVENNKEKIIISYNGVEYEENYVYLNLVIENNSDNQVVFDRTNFSIKNTSNAKTALNLYYEKNVYYNHLTGSYILNRNEKIKIKLQFDKNDISNNTILYYNGEKIADI